MSTEDVGFLCDKASLVGDGEERKTRTYRHVMCLHLITYTARTSVFQSGLYAEITVAQHNALDSTDNEGLFFLYFIIAHKRAANEKIFCRGRRNNSLNKLLISSH